MPLELEGLPNRLRVHPTAGFVTCFFLFLVTSPWTPVQRTTGLNIFTLYIGQHLSPTFQHTQFDLFTACEKHKYETSVCCIKLHTSIKY